MLLEIGNRFKRFVCVCDYEIIKIRLLYTTMTPDNLFTITSIHKREITYFHCLLKIEKNLIYLEFQENYYQYYLLVSGISCRNAFKMIVYLGKMATVFRFDTGWFSFFFLVGYNELYSLGYTDSI